jgi:hypothetical protein
VQTLGLRATFDSVPQRRFLERGNLKFVRASIAIAERRPRVFFRFL